MNLRGIQFSSVTQSCPTLCDLVNHSMPASLSITNSQSLPKPRYIESVMPSSHLILCRPFLLLPSIFPRIRVFSNESVLHIKWPKYCSFSFSFSPSNSQFQKIFFPFILSPAKTQLYIRHPGQPGQSTVVQHSVLKAVITKSPSPFRFNISPSMNTQD